MKQDPEQKIVDHFNWMLNSRLEGYERLLSKQKYLAGDQLTLADMFHVPNGHIVLKVSWPVPSQSTKRVREAQGPSLTHRSSRLRRWSMPMESRRIWLDGGRRPARDRITRRARRFCKLSLPTRVLDGQSALGSMQGTAQQA